MSKEQLKKIQRMLMARKANPSKKQVSIVPKNVVQKIVTGSGIKKTVNQNTRLAEQLKDARPPSVGRHTPFNDKIIFISGGIGDVFAIESHIPATRKQSIETILYGTRKQEPIQLLLQALNNYPNLKTHKTVWTDFSNFWCFLYKRDCEAKYQKENKTAPALLKVAEDYGIALKFPLIRNGSWPFIGSSFLKQPLISIEKFKLPENYIILAPYSSDKANSRRDFNSNDWEAAISVLHNRGMKGVVLNNGNDTVPKTDHIINLTDQTSILESIEILKKGSAYIGIDTCFSVLAAQLFKPSNLIIKCVNNHGLNNKEIYFAPHTTFEFIVQAVAERGV